MKVYEAIKTYIDNKGLKQGKVAVKAGYSEKKFSAMMKGRRKVYADDLVNICNALEVSPEEFIETKETGASSK